MEKWVLLVQALQQFHKKTVKELIKNAGDLKGRALAKCAYGNNFIQKLHWNYSDTSNQW